MKPVAWIKIRELSYMKAVAEHGKDDWQTNLGLKPESDDEGLYTETQVQRMIELLERCENEMRYAGWTKFEYEQKPVAWIYNAGTENRITFIDPKPIRQDVTPLYTAPPQREWQGLTGDEIWDEWCEQAKPERDTRNFVAAFARAIEAKLKEKNT